nr:RNA-directed DNA polymerase, eukaryota [Tanacetum cinerariifolium]
KIHTLSGNPVKKILLKLNLPDHRSILTDSQVTPTKQGRMTKPYSSLRFIANCFNAGYLKMEVKADEKSGGIIAIWDDSLFAKRKIMNDEDGFIAIYGEWTKIGIECLMIVVYAPQNYSKKCCLWNHLNSLIHNFHATSIVL